VKTIQPLSDHTGTLDIHAFCVLLDSHKSFRQAAFTRLVQAPQSVFLLRNENDSAGVDMFSGRKRPFYRN
jgi:hypothetical protein